MLTPLYFFVRRARVERCGKVSLLKEFCEQGNVHFEESSIVPFIWEDQWGPFGISLEYQNSEQLRVVITELLFNFIE